MDFHLAQRWTSGCSTLKKPALFFKIPPEIKIPRLQRPREKFTHLSQPIGHLSLVRARFSSLPSHRCTSLPIAAAASSISLSLLDSSPSQNLPLGFGTPIAAAPTPPQFRLGVFSNQAEYLKFVANQFRRLHSKKLQHTFKFYSHQWRTWAACFIQAGWRRYKRRKIKAKDKRLQESLSFDLVEHVVIGTEQEDENMESPLENSSLAKQNLGVKIMLSTCAANKKRRAMRPEEPDFSAEHDEDE